MDRWCWKAVVAMKNKHINLLKLITINAVDTKTKMLYLEFKDWFENYNNPIINFAGLGACHNSLDWRIKQSSSRQYSV